jgi:DNA repair protein RecO (recombination protein O)
MAISLFGLFGIFDLFHPSAFSCYSFSAITANTLSFAFASASAFFPDLSALIYQTRAIVLRTVKYGESSLIVDMYTEQKGHQTFVINSVRKAKATTHASSLQLLSLLELVAYHQDHRKIHRIKEARPDYTWQTIPFDMRKSAVITCLAEICSKCIMTADPHPELFAFLHDSLISYDQPGSFDRDFLIRFLVSLSHFLGFGMEMPMGGVTGKYLDLQEGHIIDKEPLHKYLMPMEDLVSLAAIVATGPDAKAEISHDVRKRLIDQLVLYYQLHVESLKEVHSLKILRELQ